MAGSITNSLLGSTLSEQSATSRTQPIEEIITERSSLPPPIVRLILKLLGRSEEGWITEWTASRGRKVIQNAITQAGTPLTQKQIEVVTRAGKTQTVVLKYDAFDIVVQYLQKSDIFGVDKAEQAAGGPEELCRIIGPYNPNPTPPTADETEVDIDGLMQKDLADVFDKGALSKFLRTANFRIADRPDTRISNAQKITDLGSLYWIPEGASINSAIIIGKKNGLQPEDGWEPASLEHGNTQSKGSCWIFFPNDLFGRGSDLRTLRELVPQGAQVPKGHQAAFCVAIRIGCTRHSIAAHYPSRTLLSEKSQGFDLALDLSTCAIDCAWDNQQNPVQGIAPVWVYPCS